MKPILTRINLSVGSLLCLANLGFWLVLPLLTHRASILLTCAVINGLLTHPFWSLIHEAIHRIYHPKLWVNNLGGRIMSILFGTVFSLVQYGHLMHHGMNRQGPDLVDAYDPDQASFWRKNLQYYLHIFGGMYLFEFFGPLLVFFPRRWLRTLLLKKFGDSSPYYQIASKKLLPTKSLWQMRFDALCLYALVVSAFFAYGSHAWILGIGILLRAWMISFSDNLPHYGTPIDQNRYAYNTYLSPLLRKFWFNFNLHRIHHEQPSLPWHQLHTRFLDKKDHYDIGYFKQGLRQLKGIWPVKLP